MTVFELVANMATIESIATIVVKYWSSGGGATSIGYNFGYQELTFALATNLATR